MEAFDRSSSSDSNDSMGHIPIMVDQVLDLLSPVAGEAVVDLTIGRGGHAMEFARRIGGGGTLVGFDLDRANLEFSRDRIESSLERTKCPALRFHHASFAQAPDILVHDQTAASVLFADLGFASNQMDDPARGFSFKDDGPLDMRLDTEAHITAGEIVNRSSERELADLIYRFGEEPLSRKIARSIVAERHNDPIENTMRLAETVSRAYGPRARHSRMHPATRTFMALRIAVNNELGNLEALCEKIAGATGGTTWLHPGARIGFLTFHSLEDRIVKRMVQSLSRNGSVEKITRKPLTADETERRVNPRSRSAKLRVFRVVEFRASEVNA